MRSFIRDKNINLTRLTKPKITIAEADEVFDDEDEKYNAKQLIQNYILPNKKS